MKVLITTIMCAVFIFGLLQIAHAGFYINVVLDTYSYDPSHQSYPYYYHYTLYNSQESDRALSHWSLFIPCMHSGSTDLNSISDPLGFTHEAPSFGEPGGSGETYYGIKWGDIDNDDLEPLPPGSSVSSFGFYSNLSQGMVEWRSKGGQYWDAGIIGGPVHGVIPEPATLSLLGLGLLGLAGLRKKKIT